MCQGNCHSLNGRAELERSNVGCVRGGGVIEAVTTKLSHMEGEFVQQNEGGQSR